MGDLLVWMALCSDPCLARGWLPTTLVVIGLGTNIAAVMWSNYIPPGRGMAAAVAWRHGEVMTEETANAVRATNTLRSVGVLWSIAIGALVVFPHLDDAALAMSMLGSR